jgi:hypothetical protein
MAPQVLYRVIYGTSKIRDHPVLVARAALLTIQPAVLHGYCRHRVRYADYPGIIPQEGESVRGTYVTGLTEMDMLRLDYFEGAEYRRDKVQAVLVAEGETHAGADAKTVDTETYVYTAGNDRLEMVEWDFDSFVKNRMPGNWANDGSEEYEGWFHRAGARRSIADAYRSGGGRHQRGRYHWRTGGQD